MNDKAHSFSAEKASHEAFHVMAKPSGPACNLKCNYCFYLEKDALFPPKTHMRMTSDTLEAYIRNTIESSPEGQPVMFTWQGGEPSLMGIGFYKQALALQKKYAQGRQIANSFQTNGVLLDEEWASFFADNQFLVGLSLDGPESIHDYFRRDNAERPTFVRVMSALDKLRTYNVDFNVMTCVTRHSSQFPFEVYEFFKSQGIKYIQFTPIVERYPTARYMKSGFSFDGPPAQEFPNGCDDIPTAWSVLPLDWGRFLTTIFDIWRCHDVGSIHVMNFEWSLAAYMNQPGVICVHRETCGRAVITEHNGDVYSCDHFVYPQYRLGNLKVDKLADMVDSESQRAFGKAKSATLPNKCLNCKYLRGCWGGCPKHRFLKTENGQYGLNYLCKGYFHYLEHIEPYLKVMADLIRNNRAPAEIMDMTIKVMRVAGKLS